MSELRAIIVPVTPFQQNCTILFDDETKEGVVIDPGGDVPQILKAIEDAELKISSILLTHGHIDHAGGAEELKDSLGVDILGPHKDDQSLLSGLEAQADMFGVTMKVSNVASNKWLNEGDEVAFSEHTFKVLHCPGHAPGHVIFYNEKNAFAHVGDVLFAGSIGRTDLPGGNHQQLLNSIRDKVLPLGDNVGFICGHGPGGQIGQERRSNPFLTDID